MDIFPTILDLLGQDVGDPDGQTLLSFLHRDSTEKVERDELHLEFHGIRYLRSEHAVRTSDGLNYIFNPVDGDELYDLNTDPQSSAICSRTVAPIPKWLNNNLC